MSDAAQDQAMRMAEANIKIAAGRQMMGGQIDIFTGLSLIGNERDAEAMRLQLHAQLDVILDDLGGIARLMREGMKLP